VNYLKPLSKDRAAVQRTDLRTTRKSLGNSRWATAQDHSPEVLLNEIADKMEATADHLDSCPTEQVAEMPAAGGGIWSLKFAEKLVYTSCYTVSFGACLPSVFRGAFSFRKNNPLVQGLNSPVAPQRSAKADAWLERGVPENAAAVEDVVAAEAGEACSSGLDPLVWEYARVPVSSDDASRLSTSVMNTRNSDEFFYENY